MMMRGKKKVKKYQAGGVSTVIGPGGPTAAQRAASSPRLYGGRNAKGIGFGFSPNPNYDPAMAEAIKRYQAQKQAAKQKASRSGGRGGGGASIIDRFRGALSHGFPQAKKKGTVTVEEMGNKKGGIIKKKKPAPVPRSTTRSGGKVHKYAEGGSVYRKGADGIATKGKTRGMTVRMRKGGMF